MTILEAMYALMLASVLVVLAAMLARSWKDFEIVVATALIAFGARTLLAIPRNVFSLVAEKDAGGEAVKIFRQLPWVKLQDTFLVQALINAPGFMFAGATQNITLLTNAFFGALAAIPAYYYLGRVSRSAAFWGMFLCVLYPAAVNFSIFGLRDIIIFTLVITYAFSVIGFTALPNRSRADVVVAAVSGFLVLWQRLELIPIMLALPAILILHGLWKTASRDVTRAGRVALLAGAATVVVGSGVLVGERIVQFVGAEMGAEQLTITNVTTVMAVNRMSRAGSNGTDGAGSNILPQNLYLKMDPVTRTALQIGGIVILPYPWLINSVSRALAGVDSLVLIMLLVVAFRYARREGNSALWAALATFGLGVFLMGLIVSNAGNAFRMRLALVPYVICVASIALGNVSLRSGRLSPGAQVE